MVDLKGQYQKIKERVDASVLEVIESSAFVNGPEVHAFQKELERIAVVQMKYDYDLAHQDKIKEGLKVVANNQTIKRSTN